MQLLTIIMEYKNFYYTKSIILCVHLSSLIELGLPLQQVLLQLEAISFRNVQHYWNDQIQFRAHIVYKS